MIYSRQRENANGDIEQAFSAMVRRRLVQRANGEWKLAFPTYASDDELTSKTKVSSAKSISKSKSSQKIGGETLRLQTPHRQNRINNKRAEDLSNCSKLRLLPCSQAEVESTTRNESSTNNNTLLSISKSAGTLQRMCR
ncbi:unnamed protein product [Phytophthora lilii]|uniref:Unnamed protein product n=1 Tax=Phytophthora lilii TaxID=2077276 RepID=A0A9W6U476_9STRA|nr:unnamed protein product [Phytophthora lilii]